MSTADRKALWAAVERAWYSTVNRLVVASGYTGQSQTTVSEEDLRAALATLAEKLNAILGELSPRTVGQLEDLDPTPEYINAVKIRLTLDELEEYLNDNTPQFSYAQMISILLRCSAPLRETLKTV